MMHGQKNIKWGG